ncbi:MAG: ABC transporter substrate-binding protein [Bacteroidales bacterium]|nr:ABC transporter substrate-binding protein [Bacteroidales bacterium]
MRNLKNLHLAAILAIAALMLLLPVQDASAQSKDKDDNYGNTPSEMLPYGNYQDAYIYHFHEPQLFTGAGREKKEPTGLTEVRIGVLAPLSGNVMAPQGNQMLQGAMLAAEEANALGGYKGLPFKIMPHNDVGLWGAAANEVVKMSDEGAWAILGTIDDVNSHVAIRVALKLEIPVVNCGDPDPTFTETNIPWVIRVIGDDRQSSYALVDYIHRQKEHKRVAVLRANNRYGRVGVMEFRDAALRIGYPLVLEIRHNDGETSFTSQLERVRNSNPDAVLLWGNALEMGLIVNQMKEMGMDYPIYASDRSVNPLFIEIAGENANGIITTCQYNPKGDSPKLKAFQENYKKQFGIEPDVFAAHAYDGMNMIIQSIHMVGMNKALIRDKLTDLKTFQGYEGITGEIFLDPAWNDIGRIWMAEIKDGDYIFSPAIWKYE